MHVVFKELDKMQIMFCFDINHKRLPYDGLNICTNHDLIMLSLSVKKVQRTVNNLQHGQQHTNEITRLAASGLRREK